MSKLLALATLFLLIHFRASGSQLIVWNVGQGQWATEVQTDYCLHYDIGGERNPTQQVLRLCQGKMNFIHLSHLDWDHISFVKKFTKQVKDHCLLSIPSGPGNKRKKQLVQSLRLCRKLDLKAAGRALKVLYQSREHRHSNSSSEVVWSFRFKTLFPGDSPRTIERIWMDLVPETTKGLILGHHGSRTSTSARMIQRLPKLKWAVASARSARYGHPHSQVIELLKKEKVPLLKTEDWGHLHFIKSKITDDKVYSPYPDREPQVHNKQNRHKHSIH